MRTSIYTVVVAAALATTSLAFAQQSTQPMPGQQMHGPMAGQGMMMGQGMGPGMMGQGMMPMMSMMDPTQHIEGRIAFLRTELGITEAQAAPWNAFADALRANAKRMVAMRSEMMSGGMMRPGGMPMMGGMAGSGMNLPDRLDRAERHMTAHLEMLSAMKGPAKQLYDVLSAEQKDLADRLVHGPMGMM